MKPHISTIAMWVGFVCITGWMFWSALFPPEGMMIHGGDIKDAYFYWKGYLREEILAGRIPYWNPYNFSGTPFLAHPNINIFYPPNWLFVLLPLSYSFAWYFFLHIFIACVTMYLLARRYLSSLAAFTSGLVYAWGGFFFARIYSGHLEYTDAASWVPLCILSSQRVIDEPTRKHIVISAVSWGILLLAGNELFFLFSLEVVSLYFVYVIRTQRSFRMMIRRIVATVASIMGGIGCAAVGMLPRMEFIRHSIRAQGLSYDVAGTGSLPWDGLMLLFSSWHWGNPLELREYTGPWPNVFEYYHFVGKTSLLLIVLGIVIAIYRRVKCQQSGKYISLVLWWFGVGVVFLAISLGTYGWVNVHELLWTYTPMYHGIRFPARHVFVIYLALCFLVGWAVEQIRDRRLMVVCLLILSFELVVTHYRFIRIAPIPDAHHDRELIQTVSTSGGLYRVLPDFSVTAQTRKDLDFGAATTHHIFSTADYNSMILRRYYEFVESINSEPASMLQQYNVETPPIYPLTSWVDFLNIRYVLADKTWDVLPKNPEKFALVMEKDRYRLYTNSIPAERFFFVSDVRVVSDETEMKKTIRDPLFRPLTEVVVLSDEPIHISPCHDARVDVISYQPSRIELKTSSSCPTILSSSETYYPGWTAWDNGKKTKIMLSNSAFRSLFIPSGEHTIVMQYIPWIFYAGMSVSMIMSAMLWVVWKKHTR